MEFQLTLSAAQTLVTESEYNLGQFLCDSGKVEIVHRDMKPGYSRISAMVLRESVMAELEINRGNISFTSFCSKHPGVQSCEDVAALLIEVTTEEDQGFFVSDSGVDPFAWKRNSKPQWERTLDRLLPVISDEPPIAEEPLGLILKVVSEPRYGGADALTLQARPARRGTKSPWVQTGVSWRNVAFDERFSKKQRRAVVELDRLREHVEQSTYRHSWDPKDWISLMDLPGQDLLDAFEALRDAGVQIVNGGSAAKLPVEFSEIPAMAHVDVRRTEQGLRMEGKLRGPREEHHHLLPIGTPPSLLAYASSPLPKAKELGLAQFAEPVTKELAAFIESGAHIIPDGAIELFETQHLDRLRVMAPLKSEDGSYRIPVPARPSLKLSLESIQAPLTVRYSWEYSSKGPRQHAVEKEIAASVQDKLGELGSLGQLTSSGIFPPKKFSTSESIDFLVHALPLLEEHPDVIIEEQNRLPKYRISDAPATVSVEAGESTGDWFDLSVEVLLGEIKVPFALLLEALTKQDEYLILDDLTVIPIDGADFAQLRQLISEAEELGTVQGDTIRIHKLSIDWWQELVDLGIIEAQHNQWLQTMKALQSGEEMKPVELSDTFNAQLRPYQSHGLSWLDFLRTHGLGGVLADDMGLGKTVQLLACLEQARIEDPSQKFLVLAPTSVVGNWINEAQRFAPQMSVTGITSTAKKSGQDLAAQIGDAQLVVTSYTIFRLAYEDFEAAGFNVMIMDEAQQLKNHASKGYKQARQLPVPCKFVVTGTPMENNLMELWALVSLAAPGLLGGAKSFKDNYQKPIADGDQERMERLKNRLRPFVLRRTKEQVVPELPAKTEQVLEVELEPGHRKAYDRRFQRVRQEVLGLVGDIDSNRFQILQSLTLLRQLALDPSLVGEGNAPSAKLEMLRELMGDAVSEGHKILVFSQFTSFLSRARDVAEELGIEHGYLDGSTSGPRRKELIDGFSEGDFPVFFISLKSGGFGINLTSADYCILLDPWWNPQAEAQAIDRAHRIGQTRPVYVYRLVAKDTIESKVLALQAKKTQLFNDVLGDTAEGAQSAALSADDFLALMD
ncbi:DEAD/DEAH box helicase [Glutamicibacter sp. 0426]|uniref:DEAD/DEAH box helicase n=1 Tax=Glutamicibacter sp. 0426 TaxID=1913445 RepID=UPI0009F94EB3|nr:DEAD/DEAH box helicase [Glutamicibacter sp. 0426]